MHGGRPLGERQARGLRAQAAPALARRTATGSNAARMAAASAQAPDVGVVPDEVGSSARSAACAQARGAELRRVELKRHRSGVVDGSTVAGATRFTAPLSTWVANWCISLAARTPFSAAALPRRALSGKLPSSGATVGGGKGDARPKNNSGA